MRPDIEEYLREQGWVFAGVSQPDHKRQWAQMDGDKVKRVALESELEDLALEIIGSPSGLDEADFEKTYKSYMESRKDDLSGNAVTVNMKDLARHFWNKGRNTRRTNMTKEEMKFQVAVSCIQGIIEAKLGIIGEIAPEIAVKESLRIADEFVRQWFGDSK